MLDIAVPRCSHNEQEYSSADADESVNQPTDENKSGDFASGTSE